MTAPTPGRLVPVLPTAAALGEAILALTDRQQLLHGMAAENRASAAIETALDEPAAAAGADRRAEVLEMRADELGSVVRYLTAVHVAAARVKA